MSTVTVGLTNGNSIELREGLAVGQQVVARAAAFLRSGDEVRPTEALDEHREAAR
jgi:HlyD family secretion protein